MLWFPFVRLGLFLRFLCNYAFRIELRFTATRSSKGTVVLDDKKEDEEENDDSNDNSNDYDDDDGEDKR